MADKACIALRCWPNSLMHVVLDGRVGIEHFEHAVFFDGRWRRSDSDIIIQVSILNNLLSHSNLTAGS